MAENAFNVFKSLLDAIQINDIGDIESIVRKIDLGRMKSMVKMFEILLMHGMRYDAKDSLIKVTNLFHTRNKELTDVSIMAMYVSGNYVYSDTVLPYMNELYPTKWNALFIGLDVAKTGDVILMYKAITKLISAMPMVEDHVWKTLYQRCTEIGAQECLQPLAYAISQKQGGQTDKDRSDHNHNYFSKTQVPPKKIFYIPEYYSEEEMNRAYNNTTLENKYVDKVNDALRRHRFSKIVDDPKDDKYISTVLGPSNPYVNSVAEPKYDIDARYGGTRMLIYEYNEFLPEWENDDEWVGICDQCHKRVDTIWLATRMPLPLGGWRHWFCSWRCTKEWSTLNEEGDDVVQILINDIISSKVKVQVR